MAFRNILADGGEQSESLIPAAFSFEMPRVEEFEFNGRQIPEFRLGQPEIEATN